jgi:protein-S-isoprenylcysteine O-methyltransferase Ste14
MEEQSLKSGIRRRIIVVLANLFLQVAMLFIGSGNLSWKWAWIFFIVSALILVINMLILKPDLIAERGRLRKDAKKWDRQLTSLVIIPFFLLFLFSGLDNRFGWSGNIISEVKICGMVVYFLSSMLISWSMISNKFFSTVVRLQTDRDHSVASGGPYQYVRHPGYVGFILMHVSIPFALGTMYALVFSILIAVLFIVRTYLEDETLKRELPGYLEFTSTTKYRLIPFLW